MGFQWNPFTGQLDLVGAGAPAGSVTSSSGSSTDNAVTRFDGTSGTVIQNSLATLDDSGVLTTLGTIDSSLTASRALATNGSKQLVSSATTTTELGYVNGVTSAIQTQLNAKQSATLTNAHILVGNVSNVATDVAVTGDIAITNAGVTSYNGVVPIAKGGTNNTSFTSGSIPFFDGTKLSENSNLFWDSADNFLLVGLTSQSGMARVAIKGENSTTGGLGLYPFSGSDYWTLTASGASLYLINPNSNRRIFEVVNTGQIAWGTANANGAANLDNFLIKNANAVGATSTTFSVQKSASQTGDLTDWYDEDGTTKLAKITVDGTGSFSNVIDGGLTASRAVVSDGSKQLASSATTSTQLGYLSGTTGTTGSGNIVLDTAPTLSDPVVGTQSTSDNSTKAASTAYVTTAIANAIAGVNPAVAVNAATTAASDTSGLTYSNGVAGIGASLTGANNTALTVDGYTFTAIGQRLLVKNDTQSPSGAYNGVYYVTQVQAALLPLILTRALDYDMPSDINNTGAIPVISGTANADTSWLLTSLVTTVGTDPLTYRIFTSRVSTGDISETSFTAADNQSSVANVTGLVFANATVRSADILLSIVRNTTYAQYKINVIQGASSWYITQSYVGDVTGLVFTITSAGQLQYTSTSTGSTATVKFRALTTSV